MSEPARHASLLDYLAGHVRTCPQREAAVEGALRLSYAGLQTAVDQAATRLVARGLGRGHVLAYIGPPGVQYLVSLLAAFRSGATWLGLNPRYKSRELRYVLQHARPALVLVAASADAATRAELETALAQGDLLPELLALATGVDGMLASLCGAAQARGAPPAPPPQQADIQALDAAVLVYTSGSTGQPKGAALTQANLVENAWWLARRLNDGGGRFLINLPVNHAGCIADTTLVALLQGDTLVFMPQFDAHEVGELLRRERITAIGQVPTQYQLMHAAGVLTPQHLATVRHLAWGGAAMPRPLIAQLASLVPDLFNSYGLTETTGTVTVTPRGAGIEALALSVGVPVFDGAVRVVDVDGQAVATGVDGELQVCGPHVFAGYLRNPEATAAALSADGWLRTGDVGHWRPDGSLRLVGRRTEMYKSGGYNIFPREVEAVLEAHPAVQMAAVIGLPDALWGEAGCAFVVAAPGAVDAPALAAWCRERLAGYKVPKRFELHTSLPLLPIGKVDRKRLPALLQGA